MLVLALTARADTRATAATTRSPTPDGFAGDRYELVGETVQMGAVRLTQSFTVFRDRPTLRASLRIENTGPTDTTVTVTAGGRHGGAQNARLAATASGDATLDASDPWYVMTSDPEYVPVGSTALYGTGPGARTPVQTTLTREVLSTGFAVLVPAGGARRLVFFSDFWATVAEAVAHMPTYESGAVAAAAGLFDGLDAAARAEVVNWVVPAA